MTAHRPVQQNANEGCNSSASLAGLVLSFIACFILLVIAPLEGYHNYDKTYKKSCKTCTLILQLATPSQSQRTIQSMNICSSPMIVSSTASPPANERNDRLTNAWLTIVGQDPGERFDRWTDRMTGTKGVTPLERRQFLAGFIAAERKLLVACCSLQLQKFSLLTFIVVVIRL